MAGRKYVYNESTLSFDTIREPDEKSTNIILRLIIYIAILYFIFGYILVLTKFYTLNEYLTIATILGGISSVAGLLSIFSKRINKDDLEKIGIEYFKEVVSAADSLKEKELILVDKETQLSTKEREIKELEVKKAELDYIVRKASMTIFLHDQLAQIENTIIELVNENKELTGNINKRGNIINKLKDLHEEIKLGENSNKVNEIILMISKDRKFQV
ncbi:MAG: hypothetical protein WBP41_16120 [Saprospiraceae bacterium]